MNAMEFIELIDSRISKQSKKEFALGSIDPNYSTGKPKVVFDGEDVATSKQYSHLSSYIPSANDRVLLAKVGGSHVILGKIV